MSLCKTLALAGTASTLVNASKAAPGSRYAVVQPTADQFVGDEIVGIAVQHVENCICDITCGLCYACQDSAGAVSVLAVVHGNRTDSLRMAQQV